MNGKLKAKLVSAYKASNRDRVAKVAKEIEPVLFEIAKQGHGSCEIELPVEGLTFDFLEECVSLFINSEENRNLLSEKLDGIKVELIEYPFTSFGMKTMKYTLLFSWAEDKEVEE